MPRKEQFNLRMVPELKAKIENYKNEHEDRYDNLTDVIREAILEKVDPIIRARMIKAEIVALRAEGDPDICALFPTSPQK